MKPDITRLTNTKLFKQLESFSLPENTYVIGGSAALLVYGIRKRISDLDIWLLSEKEWERLQDVLGPLEKSDTTDEVVLKSSDGKIEFANDYLASKKFIDKGDLGKFYEVVNEIQIMTLEAVYATKKILNRPKDRRDCLLIEKYWQKNGR